MLRILSIISLSFMFLLASPKHVHAQKYTYAFHGQVKDSATFIRQIRQIDAIQKSNVRLKPEKPGGVIIFSLRLYKVSHFKGL